MLKTFAFVKIIAAFFIDYLLILIGNAIVLIFLNLITGENTTSLLLYSYILFLTLYKITFEYVNKQTIGKTIFNIYVISANEKNRINLINISIRNYYLILTLFIQAYSFVSYTQIYGLESVDVFINEYPKYIDNLYYFSIYRFVIIIEFIYFVFHNGNKSLHDKLGGTKLIVLPRGERISTEADSNN